MTRTFRRDVLLPLLLGAVIFGVYVWALMAAGYVIGLHLAGGPR